MCELIALDSGSACDLVEGGLLYSYAVDLDQVSAITLTAGVITNFTMVTPGQFVRWDYDQDGTANFNQPGSRNADSVTIEQTAFLKFKGFSEAYINAANKALTCCRIMVIHILSNGTRVVQGIEQNAGATGLFVKSKVAATRIVPNMNTGTTQEESRMEYNVVGTARTFALPTDLDDAAIEAL